MPRADSTRPDSTPRRFGSVRRHKGSWQARYSVPGGRTIARQWPTEAQAWAWLAWMEPRCRRRWSGQAIEAMAGYSGPTNLGELLGQSRTAVAKALERGLSDAQADRYAQALGYHPTEVWGWAWVEVDLEVYPGDRDSVTAA